MIPPRPRDMNRGRMPAAWWGSRGRARRLRRLSRLLALRAPLTPFLLALGSGRQLVRSFGPGAPATGGGPVAVVSYRGEAALLPAFLSHHRTLGIAFFVFLDLSDDGALDRLLAGDRGCAVWRPRRTEDERSTLWSDYLRHRYASGRWCLSLDACDFLVFSRCETRSIRSLTDFLQTEHRDHAYALVIDMYGDRPGAELSLRDGQDPFELTPYFDAVGYVTGEASADGSVPTRGGVRRRTLFSAVPGRAPRLDRVPLVRWRRRFAYVEGTSVLRPKRLNTPHAPWHSSPTACLLRFSLLAGGRDGEATMRQAGLLTNGSRRYTGSADLVDCGMLNPGQWF